MGLIINLDSVEEKDIAYIHKKNTKEFEALSESRILFTGANGFLGYYFVLSLLTWNDLHNDTIQVTALSTFRRGLPAWMALLKKRSDFTILKKDITKYKIPQKQQYDYIIHAASIASPIFYRQYPIETLEANVNGLQSILQYVLARKKTKHQVRGILYFSSSEIYGDPTKGNIPTPETYWGNVSCTGPRACYDESKRFCETLCSTYVRVHDLPIKVARPFNNYGPGMRITDGRVIADFSQNILKNQDIIMFSNGNPSRTFCYIADAISGYLKILVKGKKGEAYNVGIDSSEVSMNTLAKTIKKIGLQNYGYSGKIQHKKSFDKLYLSDNPQRRFPDIKKARRELGYRPEISLNEGIEKTLKWYSTHKKNI